MGILQIFAGKDHDRRIFLNSIGPFWDGNEVWLIAIVGALFVAFPDVYAVILSGWATGSPPSQEDLELASSAAKGTPVFIGSGASWENVAKLMQAADGVIVSSSLKRHGRRELPIDPNRVHQFIEAARQSWNSLEDSNSKSSVKLHY